MKSQAGFTLIELLMVLWAIVCLSAGFALAWAVFHFLSKFW